MPGKRKLTVDFSDILDTIYDKIDSHELQEFLEEYIDNAKSDNKKMKHLEKMIQQAATIFPGIGHSFEEFEDNVRNGNIVEIICLVTNIFRKGLTSEEFENKITNVIKTTDSFIKETIVSKKRKIT